MKKLLFGLVATIMFSFTGSANTIDPTLNSMNEVRTEKASISIQTADAKTVYNFNSINDFKNHTNEIIEDVNNQSLDEACTVTITMTVTVTVSGGIPGVVGGEVSTTVSGSVTASCAGAVAAGKKLRASLVEMAQG
ncbi:hypothetical protein FVB9288_00074 [Flavobacterium sp. CECT 9288]|uniref:hypothetical protein n=1 Tax=Flavobacterium sp. CECT 9288 TaxID=2845819 RepID=UPI001E617D8A|nr:hypothetical protein [Flavobacterium sp. CECT 9288]CAH0334491.1 hypothetical protein FVB9288_00074 [Flavobacterium sp. CECT 9288]